MSTINYLIFLLLLLLTCANSFKFSRANITHEWLIESPLKNQNNTVLYNVVSVKNRLVYQWISCDSKPKITFKSLEIGFAPCEVPIIYENGCGCGLTTFALGNGKILVWMKDSNDKKSCWRLYFVDPDTCQYDSYRLEDYSDQTVDNVLEYKDEFDVFFNKGPLCTRENVCGMRINDKGVNVKNFTILHDGGKKFFLKTVKINQTDGYFYASISQENKTTIKFFDPDFQEKASLNLNHTIDGYSAFDERVNLCYINENQKTIITCVFYDLNVLKGNVTAFYEDEIVNMEVFNLSDGGFIVVTVTDNDGFSCVEARYFHGNEYISQRVELARQAVSDSLIVKHSVIRVGVDCITTWVNDARRIVTKCFDSTRTNNQINKCETH